MVPILLKPYFIKFQNLRTLIVRADIHEGLYNPALRTGNPNDKIQMTKNNLKFEF